MVKSKNYEASHYAILHSLVLFPLLGSNILLSTLFSNNLNLCPSLSLTEHEVSHPHERHKHRLQDNIQINLREIACHDVDWFHLAQDNDHWRDRVNSVMNFRVPQNVKNFLTS
jgi:hypothetical protein